MLQQNVLEFVIVHSINLRMIGLIFGKKKTNRLYVAGKKRQTTYIFHIPKILQIKHFGGTFHQTLTSYV